MEIFGFYQQFLYFTYKIFRILGMEIQKKVFKIIQDSNSAGEMFRILIQGKTYEQKYRNVETIIYHASINNNIIRIRTKALAYIKFLKEMSTDSIWREGDIINQFTNVETILEQNIGEIIEVIKYSPKNFKTNLEYIRLCQEVLTMLTTYKVDKKLLFNLKTLLFDYIDPASDKANKSLSEEERFIYQKLRELTERTN